MKPLRPVVLRPHLSAGLPLNSCPYYAMQPWLVKGYLGTALFSGSTHQKQGFGVFHGLRGAVNDHHVALLEHGIRARVASDDAVPPHRVDRRLRAALRQAP